MERNPFPLLRPFAPVLDTALFGKEDNATDEDVRRTMTTTSAVALKQVHGGRAVLARQAMNRTSKVSSGSWQGIARTVEADAAATDQPGLALTVRTADCQSFLVFCPDPLVIGVIHAGWKGLLAGIIPSLFDLLWEEWNIRPEGTYVCAGPSLCKECAEFSNPKAELRGISPRFFEGRRADLRAIAEDQLWNIGVQEHRFKRHGDCTKCSSRTWWSYRGGDREAVEKGSTNFLACVLRGE
ncbi:MAG: polyphenol oxidase family protein [Candidatus Peribacteraceae bacterium]|nr:polyphenol oxidase family protein [Candidatus Peribacteraceae bacterium]